MKRLIANWFKVHFLKIGCIIGAGSTLKYASTTCNKDFTLLNQRWNNWLQVNHLMPFLSSWKLWFKPNNTFSLKQQWTLRLLRTSQIKLRPIDSFSKIMKRDTEKIQKMMGKLLKMLNQNVSMRKNGTRTKREKAMIYLSNLAICKKDTKSILTWQINFSKVQTENTLMNTLLKHTQVKDLRRFIFWWTKMSIFHRAAISVLMPGRKEAITDRLLMIWREVIFNMKHKMKKLRQKLMKSWWKTNKKLIKSSKNSKTHHQRK